MLPKLFTSDLLRSELDRWNAAAKGIKNKEKKQEVIDKINFIKKKASEIDNYHSSYNGGVIHPYNMSDVRNQINTARQEVDRIIKSHLDV